MRKVSEAQNRAIKKYRERNKDKERHDTARRQARRYIKSFATREDLEELKKEIDDKLKRSEKNGK